MRTPKAGPAKSAVESATVTTVEWLSFALGVVIVVGTSVSVVKTLVVPRRAWSFVPRLVEVVTTWLFMTVARRMRSYDLADRFLGFLGPLVLIFTLIAWLAMLVIGFSLMLAPSADDFPAALGQSGAATFTLGITSSTAGTGTAVSVAASAAGLIVIALTIAYLPALYNVIKQRETLASQLSAHTGTPTWGPRVLGTYVELGASPLLPGLYADWDRWANEVADGNTKYPVLNQFRLPRAPHHWLLCLVAVLDAAGVEVSLRPSAAHGEARLLQRSGTACMLSLAASLRIEGATPTLSVTETEFVAAVEQLTADGYPAERSGAEAWQAYREWRLRYDATAQAVLDRIVAPSGPWTGGRSIPRS